MHVGLFSTLRIKFLGHEFTEKYVLFSADFASYHASMRTKVSGDFEDRALGHRIM